MTEYDDLVLAEALRRYPPSALIEDYDGDRYVDDEWGYDECQRKAFGAGAKWQHGKLKSTQTKQIEAAAKALFASEEPDRNSWRWDQPNPNTPDNPFAWHDYWLNAARIAIEAAYTVAINGVQNEDNDD